MGYGTCFSPNSHTISSSSWSLCIGMQLTRLLAGLFFQSYYSVFNIEELLVELYHSAKHRHTG